MKTTRTVVGALAVTAALGVVPAGLSAQAARAAAPSAGTLVPVSIAVDGPSWQDDQEGVRYRRPAFRVGRDYALPAGDVVREIRVVMGDVALEGRVERDVVVVFGDVRAAATAVVEGALIVIGGSASVEAGARVDRDFVVIGGTVTAPPGFAPGANHVLVGTPGLGSAAGALVPWLTRGLLWGRVIVPDLFWVWLFVLVSLLVYLAINTLLHRPVRTAAEAIVEKPVTVFLVGLLVLVLTIPVIVILAATVIGLAVVPFLLAAMFFAFLIGKVAVARVAGAALVRESSPESRLQALRSFLLGSVAILVAYLVPIVGIVTWALTSVVATGAAAVMVRRGLRREHRARPSVPAVPGTLAPAPPAASEEAWGSASLSVAPLTAEPVSAEAPSAEAAGRDAGRDELPLDDFGGVAAVPPALPATGSALLPRASFIDRVAAFALDCLLVGLALALLNLSRHDGAFPLVLLAYHIAFWAWKGTTLGGIIVGILVVRTQGTNVRFADAVIRGLSSLFSIFALGIGCFWMLQDPQRQMWHDKIAGTLVVKVPRDQLLA